MYSSRLVVPPSTTAVSLSEAKAFLSLDDQSTAFDGLLDSLIKTATQRIEDYCQRGIVTQTWQLTMDSFPARIFDLPMAGPLQNIESISYTDSDATATTIDGNLYTADTDASPGRLILNPSASWPSVSLFPSSAVKIRYVVGHEVADVPEILKTAITFYAGFLFENRDADPKLPKVVQDLLYQHRILGPVPVLRGV